MATKVLIIDDSRGDMLLIKNLFEESAFDYEILWADNGETGVEVAQLEKPDVILLDTFMPKLNGFEVLAKLKQGALKDVYVIMMTNFIENVESLDSQFFLADGYCGKKSEQILREMLRYQQHACGINVINKCIDIMLVENNRGDQVIFREVMNESKLNCKVFVLEQAEEVVHFAQKIKPQIIIMDVMMSSCSGGDAVKLLKNNPSTQAIPVVFLTGIFEKGDELISNKTIKIENQDYPAIAKPVSSKRILEEIKKYCSISFK